MAELTERVRKLVMESVGEERYKHSVRVAQTCARLCERFGLNEQVGFFVGIAHDMCKDMDEAELLETASRDGNPILKIEKSRPALLHGRAAAVLLKEDWGVDDPEILEAVANHTFGKAGMGDLAKLLYVADKIEPGRENVTPCVTALRNFYAFEETAKRNCFSHFDSGDFAGFGAFFLRVFARRFRQRKAQD